MTTIVRKNNLIYTDSKTKVSEHAEIFRYDLGPKFFVLPEKSIAVAISGVLKNEIILGFVLNLGRQLIDDFHIHEDRDRLTDLIKKITDESGITEKEVSGLGPVNYFLKDFTLRINRHVGAYSPPEEANKMKENLWTPSIELIDNTSEVVAEGSCMSSDNYSYFNFYADRTDDPKKILNLVKKLIEGDDLSGGTLNVFDLDKLLPYQPLNLGEE